MALIGNETFLVLVSVFVAFPKRSSIESALSCFLFLPFFSLSSQFLPPLLLLLTLALPFSTHLPQKFWASKQPLSPKPTVSGNNLMFPLWWLDDAWNWRARSSPVSFSSVCAVVAVSSKLESRENYATATPAATTTTTVVANAVATDTTTTMTQNTSKISTFLLDMNPICRHLNSRKRKRRRERDCAFSNDLCLLLTHRRRNRQIKSSHFAFSFSFFFSLKLLKFTSDTKLSNVFLFLSLCLWSFLQHCRSSGSLFPEKGSTCARLTLLTLYCTNVSESIAYFYFRQEWKMI